jgi:hypothetical protein
MTNDQLVLVHAISSSPHNISGPTDQMYKEQWMYSGFFFGGKVSSFFNKEIGRKTILM